MTEQSKSLFYASEPPKVRASESNHWYTRDGIPQYTVIGKNGKERNTTLRDAREHDYIPSVTTVLGVAAKPALVAWMQTQVLMAALTSTKRDGESEQDYIDRIIQDSKQQGRDAADKGTEIHTAIESFYEGRSHDKYQDHVQGCVRALEEQYGRIGWIAERSFGHELGFAGKCDLHATNDPVGNGIVVDIKTKDFTDPKDVIGYDDHLMQLSAYRVGLGIPNARCANIFVSRTEAGLCKIIEWSEEDLQRGFEMFCALLKFWQLKNKHK